MIEVRGEEHGAAPEKAVLRIRRCLRTWTSIFSDTRQENTVEKQTEKFYCIQTDSGIVWERKKERESGKSKAGGIPASHRLEFSFSVLAAS